jgi:hypothetical protein
MLRNLAFNVALLTISAAMLIASQVSMDNAHQISAEERALIAYENGCHMRDEGYPTKGCVILPSDFMFQQNVFPCAEDEALIYAPQFGPNRVGCMHVENGQLAIEVWE